MDLSAFIRRRISSQPSQQTNQPLAITDLSPLHVRRLGSSPMSLTKFLALLLLALPIFFTLSIILRHPPSDRSFGLADARRLDHSSSVGTSQRNDTSFSEDERTSIPSKDLEETDDVSPRNEKLSSKDKLLGGLLAAGFDEANCISRYQSYLYRKGSVNNPSSYLVNRLRNYEKLHQQCGPDTEPYRKALEQLRSGNAIDSGECKYVVWISFSGLGNRILALASTFLYALLTNRVLLVDRGKDMTDLFCEPFPQKSWFLPSDFPIISQFNSFDQKSSLCHGNMLKNDVLNSSSQSVPSHVYLHLVHDYNDHDKLFFCDDEQSVLAKVPWLIMKTDNYFVPSLFLIPSFEQELSKLFPDKGTVFHHLGRYLFHPSNHVWGLITRYYHTYLGKADETIGIQVRVFDTRPGPFKHVMDQILGCTLKEKLLPDIDAQDRIVSRSGSAKQKAVLVTSLNAGYSEKLRNMYWEHPTTNGEFVGVYQPSHEEYQQTEKKMHNRKAWAEMYLLSLTDKLVTSSWSTFGYVAQGLGGLKPWILYKPENETTPDPPCRRAMSMEPCFHAPPFYDCKAKRGTDTGAIVPHVRHCEDMSWGLKVVDGHDEL